MSFFFMEYSILVLAEFRAFFLGGGGGGEMFLAAGYSFGSLSNHLIIKISN